MFATGETVGLAEWIIDETCLVYYIFRLFLKTFGNLENKIVIRQQNME